MAASQFSSGSQACTPGTEHVITTNPETTDGVYQVFVETSPLATGEVLEIRIKEKINDTGDTQRSCEAITAIGGMNLVFSAPMILLFGWDVTLKQINGTGRTIQWSIRTV